MFHKRTEQQIGLFINAISVIIGLILIVYGLYKGNMILFILGLGIATLCWIVGNKTVKAADNQETPATLQNESKNQSEMDRAMEWKRNNEIENDEWPDWPVEGRFIDPVTMTLDKLDILNMKLNIIKKQLDSFENTRNPDSE